MKMFSSGLTEIPAMSLLSTAKEAKVSWTLVPLGKKGERELQAKLGEFGPSEMNRLLHCANP